MSLGDVMVPQMYKAKLMKKEEIAEDYFHLTFSLPSPLNFIAGQFMVVMADINGERVSRAYSIASPPSKGKEGIVELCVKEVKGGKMSPFLCRELKEGEEVDMMGPAGEFTLKESDNGEYYFIGTGSGIAPLRSMILHILETGKYKNITLIFGNRYKEGIPYHSFFTHLEEEGKIKYVPVLSKEENWKYKGHVQDMFPEFVKNKDALFFICGSHAMVEESTRILKDMGVKEENIFHEKY